jgi:hypothetical protein
MGDNVKIYVDVDATLLSGALNDKYEAFLSLLRSVVGQDVGRSLALFLYENFWRVSDLKVNVDLLEELKSRIENGAEAILWTNRGPKNFKMTKKNLGPYWELFSEYHFCLGHKTEVCIPEPGSEVWDDDVRNKIPGCAFRHIQFK